jgi:purine-binding chemotaxis protein CheW
LRGQELGVPIADVKETIELRPLTRVPLTPNVIAGLMNLRGEVVAVLDLAALLGLRHAEAAETRIVVLRRKKTAGVLVDELTGVRTIREADVVPPPPALPAAGAALLQGVVTLEDHPLLLLDCQRLLEHETLRPFQRDERA